MLEIGQRRVRVIDLRFDAGEHGLGLLELLADRVRASEDQRGIDAGAPPHRCLGQLPAELGIAAQVRRARRVEQRARGDALAGIEQPPRDPQRQVGRQLAARLDDLRQLDADLVTPESA